MAIAEIISIGTELLLGQIVNTNSHFLAGELASLGLDSIYQVTVGDNARRIKAGLRDAFDRSDVVITTGGLGPTADDLTHESIAELFAVPMQFDEPSLKRIIAMFQLRGLPMPESNRKQAMRPTGADILPNSRGTAPGIIWKLSESLLHQAGIADPQRPRFILTFPGVPGEMKTMWKDIGQPFLSQQFGPGVIWSIDLKHFGISESLLGEKYAELLNGTNPTVAPLAGSGECRLRVSAKANSIEIARKMAQPVVEDIIRTSAHICYGQDDDTLEGVVARVLIQRRLSVSVAESCTGGLVSKRLTDIPGSSTFIKLNVVTYSNDAKNKLLGVSHEVLNTYGAVSRECAEHMALGIRTLAESDIGISITGIAGPDGGTDDKPVGLVYIGLSTAGASHVAKRLYHSQISRSEIRHRSANDAINMVRLYLLDPALLQQEYAPARQ